VMLRNPEDAEDVTQTTFLNAYRAYGRGERPRNARAWLIAIAHNVCRQRFRQSARRPSEVTFEDDIADTIVDEETPTGEDIRRALSHLAFNQRAAIVMRELEGRSYSEIAEILDTSTSAVETLIFRARRALREQLEGSLTCGEAELATSRQLDGRLPRAEKGQLRAHLRECPECARFARRQRAQRSALKSLALVPVPTSLASFFGGGGAAVGTGVALKAAAAVAAGLVIGGGTYEGVRQAPWRDAKPAATGPKQVGGAASATPSARLPNSSDGVARPATIANPKRGLALGADKTKAKKAKNAKNTKNAKNSKNAHASGRGQGKTRYAGDASVSARHVKVRQSPVRAHPAQPPKSLRGAKSKPRKASRTPGKKP